MATAREALDARHHTVLQALLARGPLAERDAKLLAREAANVRENGFHEFIAAINSGLEYVQMEIRPGVAQETGSVHYGLVNKVADSHAKFGTRFSHAQICFFKAVVEAIALDPEASGSIGSTEALNLQLSSEEGSESQTQSSQASALRLLSKTERQNLLRELAAEQWLRYSEDGRIGLGVRTYLELKSYLKSIEGVPACEHCDEAAIRAQVCSNPDCSARLHWYCAQRKFSRTTVSRVCANETCRAEWPVVGAAIVERENVDERPVRVKRGRRS